LAELRAKPVRRYEGWLREIEDIQVALCLSN
jgi:hypothetical protein